MQLIKEVTSTEISGNVKIQNLHDLINLMINYYQATFIVDLDKWLTKKQRLFYIACVIISNKDIRYTSDEGKKLLMDIFDVQRQSDVGGYLRDIEKKSFWHTVDVKNKKINVKEFFKFDLQSQEIILDIKLNYESNEN